MSRKIVLGILFFLIASFGQAQEAIIRGIVTDSISGEGLPYASLIYKGTNIGTATDMDGHYELPSPDGTQTLEVSYLGYTTKVQTILPHQHGKLDIRLSPDGIALQEVTIKPGKEKYSKKDNPAVRFVKQMIERRDSHTPHNKDYYQYDQYEKMLLGLNEFERKPKKDGKKGKFDFLNEFVDTLKTGATILPILEKEKTETVLYRKNPKSEKRIVKGLLHRMLKGGVPHQSIALGISPFVHIEAPDMGAIDIPLLKEVNRPLVHSHRTDRKNEGDFAPLFFSLLNFVGDFVSHFDIEFFDIFATDRGELSIPEFLGLGDILRLVLAALVDLLHIPSSGIETLEHGTFNG